LFLHLLQQPGEIQALSRTFRVLILDPLLVLYNDIIGGLLLLPHAQHIIRVVRVVTGTNVGETLIEWFVANRKAFGLRRESL
jgi:hypothetical protein